MELIIYIGRLDMLPIENRWKELNIEKPLIETTKKNSDVETSSMVGMLVPLKGGIGG